MLCFAKMVIQSKNMGDQHPALLDHFRLPVQHEGLDTEQISMVEQTI